MNLQTKTGRLIVNMAVAIFMTIVALVLGELVIRFFYKDSTVLFPRYHTDAKYGDFTLRKIRTNAKFWHKSIDGEWEFTTNNQGFRNKIDFSYAKNPNTVRIISIGDSHTQGYEVRQEYTFSAVAERYLRNKGYKAEVINAGVSGFSTAEELVFLENEGIRYDPDVVFVGFSQNDLEDNIKAGIFELDENRGLITVNKTHIPGVNIQNVIYSLPFITYLSENSYLYSVLFNATWHYFKTKLARQKSEQVMEYAIATQTKFSDYQVSLASKLIERMYKFCKDNNIKLVVIDIPVRQKEGSIKTALTPALAKFVGQHSDVYLDSNTLLGEYSGIAELHVPHGHNHISEITHTIIGIAAAKNIEPHIEEIMDRR